MIPKNTFVKDLYLEFDQDPQQSEQCETTW